MFKVLILKELMQIPSRRKLADFLRKNEYWAKKCGFESPPHHDCFSEFIKRLGKELFIKAFNELVRQLKEMGAMIGNIIAVDSTIFKAYSKFYKDKKPSDPDAGFGVSHMKEWVFGYKLHLACDAEVELPISFKVTPANVYDSTQYPEIIRDLVGKGFRPRYILADAGYDTKENRTITEIYGTIPIIALNPRRRGKERSDEVYSLPHYEKRSAIERVFSRLKEELGLKMLKVRGLWKVAVHATISLMAMLSVALTAAKIGRRDLMNSINYFRF